MELATTLIHVGALTPQLSSLKNKLDLLGVSYNETVAGDYNQELRNYDLILNSDCIIGLCPDGVVTPDMSRWALYAMTKNKPIIILETPANLTGIDNFTKQVMGKRFNKLLVCNLLLLDNQDATAFLKNT